MYLCFIHRLGCGRAEGLPERVDVFLAHVLSWLTNLRFTYYSNTSKSEPEGFSKSGNTDGLLNMCFY